MPTPDPKRRWYRLTPDRLVIGLLFGVCLLWLSERFQWFGFNHHKGWTVLIAVAGVGVAALVMLLWWVASLTWRWQFQFGIRSLLMLVVVCSIAAGWLAVEMQRARRQAEVVEGIEKLGGWWQYEWQVDADGRPTGNSEPPWPGWLWKTLGVDFFSVVVQISFVLNRITDSDLEQLNGLNQLHDLNLNGTQVTDAGLEHFTRMTQLRWLDLSDTMTTDAGVQRLQQALPNCKIIH